MLEPPDAPESFNGLGLCWILPTPENVNSYHESDKRNSHADESDKLNNHADDAPHCIA